MWLEKFMAGEGFKGYHILLTGPKTADEKNKIQEKEIAELK